MSIPASEIRQRQKKLRRHLKRDGLSGVFLCHPQMVTYYSGFTGRDSYLLLTSGKSFLLTDSRYTEEAAQSTTDCSVQIWKENPYQHAGKLVRKLRMKRTGVESHQVTIAAHRLLKKGAGSACAWKNADLILRQDRQLKTPWEVRAIQKALKIAEAAFLTTRQQIRVGMLETELAAELEYQMRKLGADGPAFPSIIASGANASLPHAHPGRRKIARGKLLLIDWGASLGGYNSDLTRTLFVDSIPALWRRRYEAVLQAQSVGIQAVAADRAGAEADQAARKSLQNEGLAEYFGHALGHGVGLDVHEGPTLSHRNTAPLQAGAVVTVEPGIYFPGRGGIRIEDMVLVTPRGPKVLSTLPKDLDWAVVKG